MEPPSLVGRADELRRLEAALAAAAEGRGSTVLIAGEAGIGKTRLASELAERAREAGATVLSGRCIDLVGSGLPYLPLVEALRPLRRSPALANVGGSLRELSRLVPELSEPGMPMPPAVGGPDSQLRLLEETRDVLERVGAEAPVVLVLEDLHWADGSTLDLVAFLAHAARAQRMLVVATYRSDEIEPESSLRRLVTELLRAREAAALTLERLGPDEVERLLVSIAEAPLPAERVTEICERSEGNPFFAEELVAAAERGEETLPRALRDVLLQRFAGLDGETQSLLRVAAAAGRDVPYRLLAAVGAAVRGAARRGAAPGGRARRARARPTGGIVPVPARAAGRGDLHDHPPGRARGAPRPSRPRPQRRRCPRGKLDRRRAGAPLGGGREAGRGAAGVSRRGQGRSGRIGAVGGVPAPRTRARALAASRRSRRSGRTGAPVGPRLGCGGRLLRGRPRASRRAHPARDLA